MCPSIIQSMCQCDKDDSASLILAPAVEPVPGAQGNFSLHIIKAVCSLDLPPTSLFSGEQLRKRSNFSNEELLPNGLTLIYVPHIKQGPCTSDGNKLRQDFITTGHYLRISAQ